MRLLTSAVAFIAAAKAQDNTDLAPECPVQPSCGCSPEDVEAWEGRIARWEGEMDRWETSMQEWRDRQAASKSKIVCFLKGTLISGHIEVLI